MNTTSSFAALVGNERIKGYLSNILLQGKWHHSLLFAGPDGVGKTLFARAFAREIVGTSVESKRSFDEGNHPDFHLLQPEGKVGMHNIQALREMNELAYKPPYAGSHRVFIIQDAERMLTYSANALLKTFEEPPLSTLIILTSSAPNKLLPTILSRCQTFHFQAASDEELTAWLQSRHYEGPILEHVLARAHGSFAKAERLLNNNSTPLRDAVLKYLSTPTSSYLALLASSSEWAEMIEREKLQFEEALRQTRQGREWDILSAPQKEEIEKEIEGIVSLKASSEVTYVFEMILCWYRDLWLIASKGDYKYLFNRDAIEALYNAIKMRSMKSLEAVEQAIRQARLSLERSTPVPIVLENLLLMLD